MKEKYIQALKDVLDGSNKLAEYAYSLVTLYIEEHPVKEYYDDDIDGYSFEEWSDFKADENDYYYTCYYSLYDYAHDQPPYGDAFWLFEDILKVYIDTLKRISDSSDIDSFAQSFEPYVIERTVEDDDSFEERTYGYDYDKNIARRVYVIIGDKNSDLVFNVIVYDISDYGQYSFDIDSIDNTDLNDSVLTKNDTVWSKIDELIYDEVVFNDAH